MTRFLAKRQLVTLGLIVCGLVTFAGCGAANIIAPLSASDIISKAQNAHPKDATFTLGLMINGTSSGAAVNTQFTGNGELTRIPPRSHVTINATVSGISVTVEDITDGTTQYSKTTSPSLPSDGKWTKTTVASTDPANLSFSSLYTNIKNPKLVGTEKVNGYDTYHITGTPIEDTPTAGTPATSTTSTATEDIWVKTDNFYPVKLSVTGTSASGSGLADTGTTNTVITFTKWDSGVTIALPSPDQISAGS